MIHVEITENKEYIRITGNCEVLMKEFKALLEQGIKNENPGVIFMDSIHDFHDDPNKGVNRHDNDEIFKQRRI